MTHIIGIGGGYFAPTSTSFIPLPASYVPMQTLIGNFPVHELADIYSLRLDHKLTNNQQLMLRGSVSPDIVDGIEVNAQGPQNFGQNSWSRTSMNNFHDWSIIAEHTWTIGNNKVNEFRFQYARRSVNYSYSNAPGGSDVAVNIPGYRLLWPRTLFLRPARRAALGVSRQLLHHQGHAQHQVRRGLQPDSADCRFHRELWRHLRLRAVSLSQALPA